MYKEASKIKLRIATSVGSLSIEQLWELDNKELDDLAIELQEKWKDSGKKSFLVTKSKKDKLAKLKFDIVLDVLETKIEEASTALSTQETKAHNAKILDIIESKNEESLHNLTVEELEGKLIK